MMFGTFKDGQPCPHPGCFHHLSHPCEVCGRIGAKGKATVFIPAQEFGSTFIEDKENDD